MTTLAAKTFDDAPDYSTDEERVRLAYDQVARAYDQAFTCRRDRAEDARTSPLAPYTSLSVALVA